MVAVLAFGWGKPGASQIGSAGDTAAATWVAQNYASVIDQLMPFDRAISVYDSWVFNVRGGPQADAEFFLVVRKRGDGSVQAKYVEPIGTDIGAQLHQLLKKQRSPSVAKIASLVRLRQITVLGSGCEGLADAATRLEHLTVNVLPSAGLTVDGASIAVDATGLGGSLHVVMGSEAGEPHHELMEWTSRTAKLVRRCGGLTEVD